MKIENKNIVITGNLIKTARIDEEWDEDLVDPIKFIDLLKQKKIKADIFTFWQRLPDITPKYDFFMEWDNIAAIPVKSYDYWWTKQIGSNARNMVSKAKKKGLVIKESEYNDTFISGMVKIFNETPVRQGKPFRHYGKDFETIKREFSKYVSNMEIIGAYYNDELVGFIMLVHGGIWSRTAQIISLLEHRDKAPNNALIAKAVEICAIKNVPYCVYANWASGSLAEFKQRNGFEKIALPRYYVPLNIKGRILLALKLHKGISGVLPESLLIILKKIRALVYDKKVKFKSE